MGSMVLDLYSDNWLISPAISTTDNDRYEVSWSVAAGSDYYCKDHYGVYLIVGTDTTLLFEETLTASDASAFRPCTVALPASLNGEFRIAFRHFNSTGGYMVILDNIAVRRLTAPTVTLNGPSAVNHNTDVTYAALSGSADTYHWSVDGQPVDGSSSTLTTRFAEPGNHNVRVTVTNSVGSAGASLDVQVFNCDPVTQFPYVQDFEQENVYACWDYIDADGDSYGWEVMHNVVDDRGRPMHIGHNSSNGVVASASYVGSGQSGTPLYPDNWMILPAMSIPAGQHLYLSWYDKGMHPQYAAEKYSVYISTSGREVRDFTLAGGYTATPYWTGHSIDLQSYAGQTIYIAFRHHNVSDMYVLEIDDISVSGQALGINEASSTAAFSLYPNPASSSVLVSGLEQGAQVSVVNMNGRVLNTLTAQGSSLTLDVSGMARGAYFVRVSTATNSSVSKLIVK